MPYAGDMLLFRAIRSGVAFHLAGHTLGWGETVRGQVEVHEIDANHDSIITPPAIDIIADVIAARLRAVDSDSAEAEPVIATSD
jgi:thioesterase domain-containing protein